MNLRLTPPREQPPATLPPASAVPDLVPEAVPEPVATRPPKPPSELRGVIRLLIRYAGGPRLYLVALGLLVAEAVTAVFQPYPIAYLIDFFKGDRPPLNIVDISWLASPRVETLLVLTVGLLVLTMVNSLADSLAEICLARGGRTLGYNMRETLYQRLHRLSVAFHDHRRTGDMLTRVTSDVTAVEEFVVNSFSDLLGSVLVLVGTLAFLLWQSWQVAVVAMLIVPLLALVSNYFSQRIKTASKTLRAREGELASVAQEMLSSIRVIQTYGRSGYEERRFADQSRQAVTASLETASLKAKFSWLVAVLEAVAIAAVAWIGLVLIDRQAVTVGTLVLFIILIQNMFKPTRKIIREWTLIGKVFASVERIAEVLQREAKVRDRPGAVAAPPFGGRLTFEGVHFAYQLEDEDAVAPGASPARRVALRDVSFDVAPGQVVALVGASGAGKSTIAQLIPRLYDPDEGRVCIDGLDIRDVTLESLRAQIGVVLQDTVLFSGTVAENIAYGREDATPAEVVDAAVKAHADGFIRELPEGYETLLGERGANLSGGQRQRIAIARAFVRNSPIVILDEPTTGLDSMATEQVLSGLHSLMQDKTTVIISHDLHLIQAADLVLVLEAGRIVQSGTHQSLVGVPGPYAVFCAKQGLTATGRGDGPAPDPQSVLVTEAAPDRSQFRHQMPQRAPDRAGEPDRQPAAASVPLATPAPVPGNGNGRSPSSGATPQVAEATRTLTPVVPEDLDLGAHLPAPLEDLVLALDPELMAAELQECLFGGANARHCVQQCVPGKGMFMGSAGVSVRYQLVVRDGETGELREELVLGRLLADQAQAREYQRQLAPLVTEMGGRPETDRFARLAGASPAIPGLVVHAYPLDPELPTLVEATDPERMHAFFSTALGRSGLTFRHLEVGLGHYGRRHRCVLRYHLAASSGESTRSSSATIYGKVYAGETGVLVSRVISAARQYLDGCPELDLRVPRHLGYLPHLHLSLLSRVPGRPVIADVVRTRGQGAEGADGLPSLEEAVDDAARVIASVHRWPVPSAPERTLAGDVDNLRRQLLEMEAVSPKLAGHLLDELDAVEAAATATSGDAPCFSHGDYTLPQLLHDGRSLGLVDFDSACEAEPAMDLGHFLAYLDLTLAKHPPPTGTGGPLAPQLADRFLATYCGEDGGRSPGTQLWERVGVYHALSLLRITVHSWQKLKPARTRLVLPVLQDRVRRLS